MSEVAAALGRAQLRRLPEILARRRTIYQTYEKELSGVIPILQPYTENHACHLFVVLAPDRARLTDVLKKRGIGYGIHYDPPLHLHPFYGTFLGYQPGDFPNAERISKQCVSLPLFPQMTDGEVERVIQAVREAS